ncbi:MAG: hypothetical protein AB7V14_12315, partial [Kiritimatiellia bacterium]
MRINEVIECFCRLLWIVVLFMPLVFRGGGTLQFRMATAQAGTAQVFYDTGLGYNEKDSIVCPIDRTDSQPFEVRVSLPNA